jgi:hypothetical protein
VVDLVDFFPRPKNSNTVAKSTSKQMPFREAITVQDELKKWLVRRVECIRGTMDIGTTIAAVAKHNTHGLTIEPLDVEIFPAFDYARAPHTTEILMPTHLSSADESKTVTFASEGLKLQLDVTIDRGEDDGVTCPSITFEKVKRPKMLGEGVVAHIRLHDGQAISFVLRDDIPNHVTQEVTTLVLDTQQHDTQNFWFKWISQSKYKGRWREVVSRSLMILKMLTFEPTGAIIAAPTFSVPEDIGGVR